MFLRMAARPLMAKVKQTTGIKVPEDAHLREVLTGLYSQILNQIKKLPEYLSYRDFLEERMNYRLKVCQLEEDMESITRGIILHPSKDEAQALIEEARCELSELSGLIADWHSCIIQPIRCTPLIELYYDEKPRERELLIELYYDALNVVRKVPESNKLRMFAESSISRKLEVCWEKGDWEYIKSKLDYEDPIQKAREQLDHSSLFFGPDAHPNRQYPLVPRTKDFCEWFDAWCELASPEIFKSSYSDKCVIRNFEDN